MLPHDLRGGFIESAPDLNKAITDEMARIRAETTVTLPKYQYPDNVVTATRIGYLAVHGVEFTLDRDECAFTRCLDSQKEAGKGIYGSGYLISDAATARLLEAEAEAEAEPVQVWELSDREREVIAGLS